jgi:ABC-2 type transport system permease protein
MNDQTVSQTLISVFTNLYSNVQIAKLGITPEQIAAIEPNFDVSFVETEENTASGNVLIMMIISAVLFYAIIFCAQSVSMSVTTEKTSKIIETLVTSTDSKAIVLGKTLGVGIIGLIQLALIVGTAIISANVFVDPEMISSLVDVSNITPQFILITFVYFILGYTMYSLAYAVVGSTVSKPEDVQSANSPVAIIAVVGFYLSYFSMMNPTSNINKISGIVPISSPFGMPLRIMMGTATTGEIALSLAILLITTAVVAVSAIKIYSSTILNTGSRITLKQAIKMTKESE